MGKAKTKAARAVRRVRILVAFALSLFDIITGECARVARSDACNKANKGASADAATAADRDAVPCGVKQPFRGSECPRKA